jgi:hypothetical protein
VKGHVAYMRPSALSRFNKPYRVIRDDRGNIIAHAIPNEHDIRSPRAVASGRASGWLVQHTERNRARRRQMSRGAVLGMVRGSNKPVLAEQLTAAQIVLDHEGER